MGRGRNPGGTINGSCCSCSHTAEKRTHVHLPVPRKHLTSSTSKAEYLLLSRCIYTCFNESATSSKQTNKQSDGSGGSDLTNIRGCREQQTSGSDIMMKTRRKTARNRRRRLKNKRKTRDRKQKTERIEGRLFSRPQAPPPVTSLPRRNVLVGQTYGAPRTKWSGCHRKWKIAIVYKFVSTTAPSVFRRDHVLYLPCCFANLILLEPHELHLIRHGWMFAFVSELPVSCSVSVARLECDFCSHPLLLVWFMSQCSHVFHFP